MVVVSVYDSAVAAYMNPWFAPSIGSASRAFHDEVVRNGSPMSQHPTDYVLFSLGTFDPETGRFQLHDIPQQVIRGADCAEVKDAS